MDSLSDMCSKSVCTIKWMFGLPADTDRLLRDCEIAPGREVLVVQNDRHGLILRSGGRRVAIDSCLAAKIRV